MYGIQGNIQHTRDTLYNIQGTPYTQHYNIQGIPYTQYTTYKGHSLHSTTYSTHTHTTQLAHVLPAAAHTPAGHQRRDNGDAVCPGGRAGTDTGGRAQYPNTPIHPHPHPHPHPHTRAIPQHTLAHGRGMRPARSAHSSTAPRTRPSATRGTNCCSGASPLWCGV